MVQPLTTLMAMLPHSLESLILSKVPSLVELPSSFQNFTKLSTLTITDCINLESLPTDINMTYLPWLNLSGCSGLKTFPNISTNVQCMNLAKTGIEEVPWWIENFSQLEYLSMNGCNGLKSVSLHISKLKKLHGVDFSDCGALSEASWNDSSSDVAMETDNIHSESTVFGESSSSFPENFINCFNLYHFYEEKHHTVGSLLYIMLTGEEVLPYFKHRTTETSITDIPLFHSTTSPPLFFRFKVCAVIDCKSCEDGYSLYNLEVSCQLKSRLGNHFKPPYITKQIYKQDLGIHLVIFECSFPLNEVGASPAKVIYDSVDIRLQFTNYDDQSKSELKGWGIRLSDEFSLQENQAGNGITLRDVCEDNEDNVVSEIEAITESEDINEDTERSKKQSKITKEEHSSITLPWISLSILFLLGAVVAMFFFSDYLKGPL